MYVAICDDQVDFLQDFKSQMENYLVGGDRLYWYKNGLDLLQAWQEGLQFDVIFLDVEMPGLSGFEVASEIRKVSEDVLLVVITDHSKYALESFQHAPLDFLVKPVEKMHIAEVLKKVRRVLPLPPTFVIASGSGNVRVPINEILYLEIFMGKVTVHTTNGDYTYNGRLFVAKKALEPHGFFLCHRSLLINLDFIERIHSKSREVILRHRGERHILPVSVDRLQMLLGARTERDLN